MNPFGLDGFGTLTEVSVEVYTGAYRVSGTIRTRFERVADILNQLTGSHLALEDAAVSEYADPSTALAVPSALVAVEEILVLIAPELGGPPREDMRIQKRPVHARLAIPPLRLAGTIHVAMGSRPVDGLLNVPDRFMAMTNATIASAAHPELERSVPVLALRRDRAHVLVVERTAEAWLHGTDEPAG